MQLRRLIFVTAVSLLTAASPALASTTWYVDGVHGSDNNNCKSRQDACKTIGHAISLASKRDTIKVGPATYTENLTIGISVKVMGSGASTTIIDGGGASTVVAVSATDVVLSKFTIRNGKANYGGGIFNSGMLTINDSIISGNTALAGFRNACSGGGVLNDGTLSINHTTISGNKAVEGGGLCIHRTATINNSTITGNTASDTGANPNGGGIFSTSATLTINNSTISGNVTAQYGDHGYGAEGGGIYGSATVNNSTISGNSAGGYSGLAGGIYGSVTVSNSTITGNSASYGVGGIIGGYQTTLENTIVAGNSNGNCGININSNGYNLSSDNTCNFNNTGDLNNTDPKLGQLGNYGGPTQTIPLLAKSPAIDAGNPYGCTDGSGKLLKTDQRGKPRPDREDKTGCDMGAYERQKD
jgi:hypothetical protein